jgi:hypothetical protein
MRGNVNSLTNCYTRGHAEDGPPDGFNIGDKALSFWSQITTQNKPRIQSWVSDQLEYLLQFTTLALAYAGFALLRFIGVRGSILDLMETLDRIAIGLVFARFLLLLQEWIVKPAIQSARTTKPPMAAVRSGSPRRGNDRKVSMQIIA